MRSCLLVVFAFQTIACVSNVDPTTVRGHADLVFLSGAIYTVDPQRPWAEAVAVRGGRIAAVGSDSEVRPYVGDDTRVVDLEGRMLLPGFHDAHIHPVYAGLDALECWLGGLSSVEAVLAKLSACAASGPGGEIAWSAADGASHSSLTATQRRHCSTRSLPTSPWP